ncbi:hypothetical protein ACFRCW_32170 [Streptomyces sp. NPDC056653]|uniref:hypothetical protein n=1 Tax=Streptomyces sp. NPDC056653 TaxID=3345894 RepID=UPI0036D02D02
MAAVAASTTPPRPTDPDRPARSRDPIDLTVPEIRHLLAASFNSSATPPARLLHWSNWRRRHQATARRSHYQRRLADAASG